MTQKTHIVLHIVEGAIIVALSLFIAFIETRPTDTIIVPVEVRDTITVEKERIVEHTKIEYITKFDTVIAYVTDSAIIEVPVEIPIEHCLYQDTLKTDSTDVELAIKYSGFKPSLDSIGISYHYTGERAVEVKKSGFRRFVGAGAYAGVGVGYDPMHKTMNFGTPEVGVALVVGWGYTW